MSKILQKVLVCITEDWFALSHFQPLLRTLANLADEVVVATRSSGRMPEIAALGCRPVEFDFRRSSLQPLAQAAVIRRLARLIGQEQPDVVHAIAMQTLIVTGLAIRLAPVPQHVILHLTGLGFLGISNSNAARLLRPIGLKVLADVLKDPRNWLLAENPEDVQFLRDGGVVVTERLTILGGAGVDPKTFPALPPPNNAPPVAAFVGRMIRSKGVAFLVEAQRRMATRGVGLAVALYGSTDQDNPEAVPAKQIERWAAQGGVTWHGHVSDVRDVWARCDIAVLPAITREGLPRSVLEAAACARPVIVTDVPGCRHFVRDRQDGLIVPPADPEALATALTEMAGDPSLRLEMGRSARQRVLAGFTIDHVTEGIRQSYMRVTQVPARS